MPRGLTAFVLSAVAFVALGVTSAGPAQAATMVSSRTLLNDLATHSEHGSGYARSKFGSGWLDADHDGCDTRDEVLIAEAVSGPHIGAGCALSVGSWFSPYDGVATTAPSGFDIDHLVPLAEAWQSGAWRWTAGTRSRYANDLGYAADLIAVTAHSNRSKGEKEPQDWMPARASYRCRYLANWVAVKWRWRLRVNPAELSFLRGHLRACGWPSVRKPSHPTIALRSTTTTTGGTTGSLDPRFDYCYEAKAAGYGPYYRGVDPEYDWYTDADNDGVVCE
jgi:hypothetical protein